MSTLTLNRPEDISDGLWEALKAQAHKVITGHAPWCTEHQGDDSDSYCQHTDRAFCAEVVISTGTLSGGTMISLYLGDGVKDDALTISEAAAIAVLLEGATIRARHANINGQEDLA